MTDIEKMKEITSVFTEGLETFEKQLKDAALLYSELEEQKAQNEQLLERINVATGKLLEVMSTLPPSLRAELDKQLVGLMDEPRNQMEGIMRPLSAATTTAVDTINRVVKRSQTLRFKAVAGLSLIAMITAIGTALILWKFQLNASDYEYARIGRHIDQKLKKMPVQEREKLIQILNFQ